MLVMSPYTDADMCESHQHVPSCRHSFVPYNARKGEALLSIEIDKIGGAMFYSTRKSHSGSSKKSWMALWIMTIDLLCFITLS